MVPTSRRQRRRRSCYLDHALEWCKSARLQAQSQVIGKSAARSAAQRSTGLIALMSERKRKSRSILWCRLLAPAETSWLSYLLRGHGTCCTSPPQASFGQVMCSLRWVHITEIERARAYLCISRCCVEAIDRRFLYFDRVVDATRSVDAWFKFPSNPNRSNRFLQGICSVARWPLLYQPPLRKLCIWGSNSH